MHGKAARLVDWALTRGAYLHPSIDIDDDPNTGLSFCVKPSATAIAANEPIVRIPSNLTLSFANAVGNIPRYAFDYKDILLKRLPPHVIGRLLLVREYLRDESSFWRAYMIALPLPEYDDSWKLPPFWTDGERAMLKGTNLETGAQTIIDTVKREYEDLQEALKEAGDEWLRERVTYDLYCWAYCIFSSRSFRPSLVLSKEAQDALPEGVKVDDFSVLMPLLDIGNHDMTLPVRWEVGKEENVTHGSLINDEEYRTTCELRVGKAFAPGEQVFNNYSAKSNAELLLGYGFMIPPTETLHNDYIHLRKRGGAPGEEYFVSLRPVTDPSSVMIRAKMGVNVEALKDTLPAFARVQPEMIWDIVTMVMDEEQRQAAMPVEGDEAKMAMLLAGKVAPEYKPLLEQLAGTIQGKLIQELEKLNEDDVEVEEEDIPRLCEQQVLALQYRERCRAVLEAALTAIDEDPYFF